MPSTLTRGWAFGRSRATTRKAPIGQFLLDWLTGAARRRGERHVRAENLSHHMERDIGLRDVSWSGGRLHR